jgi:hypothetical protein
VIVVEILGAIAMGGALIVDWRSDGVSRLSLALWVAALLALVVADAWAPLIALFGINVGGRGAALNLVGKA